MNATQIIDNMGRMSGMCRAICKHEKQIMDDAKEETALKAYATARHDSFNFIAEWLDDLIDQYNTDERRWHEAMKILESYSEGGDEYEAST